MQKKHAKGLFIDSSYRRASLLKTLLTGHLHARDAEETGDESKEGDDQAISFPGSGGPGVDDDETQMRIAASL